MRCLVLDTETTAKWPSEGQIIELAWCVWDLYKNEITETYQTLFHAESNPAYHINKIPENWLRGTPKENLGKAGKDLYDVAKRVDCVIAHNVPFDRNWVHSVWGGVLTDQTEELLTWACSCSQIKFPNWKRKSRKLTTIAEKLGVSVKNAHRALDDCLLLVETLKFIPDLYQQLIQILDRNKKSMEKNYTPKYWREKHQEHTANWEEWRQKMRKTEAWVERKKRRTLLANLMSCYQDVSTSNLMLANIAKTMCLKGLLDKNYLLNQEMADQDRTEEEATSLLCTLLGAGQAMKGYQIPAKDLGIMASAIKLSAFVNQGFVKEGNSVWHYLNTLFRQATGGKSLDNYLEGFYNEIYY